MNIIIKRRSPYIIRAGGSGGGTIPKRKRPYNFCNYCGFETAYIDSFHAHYCNHCGTVQEVDPEQLKREQEQERQAREQTYTIADGSAIYNPETYTRSNIKHGRTYAIPGSSGRTVAIKRQDAIIDKLRMKDGRSKEMDAIFRQQDKQMESMGRTILEDKLELRRSSNVKTSDELRAEKAGTVVDLSSSSGGKYNPATRRSTRLSF